MAKETETGGAAAPPRGRARSPSCPPAHFADDPMPPPDRVAGHHPDRVDIFTVCTHRTANTLAAGSAAAGTYALRQPDALCRDSLAMSHALGLPHRPLGGNASFERSALRPPVHIEYGM